MSRLPFRVRLQSGDFLALNDNQRIGLKRRGLIAYEDGQEVAASTVDDMTFFQNWAELAQDPICDFCGIPIGSDDVLWSYPSRDFRADAGRGSHVAESIGAWVACALCHRLIAQHDRRGLTRRAVRMFFAKHPELAAGREARHKSEAQLSRMHNRFWRNRLGDPVRER